MPDGSSELTDRQRAVLERIERRVPIKLIAAELGISPTRVNQHVRAIKDLYGANNLGELVDIFRERPEPSPGAGWLGEAPNYVPFTQDAYAKDQLPPGWVNDATGPRDDPAKLSFSDAMSISVQAPWGRQERPTVVPGMLDGHNFVTARLLAMLGGAVGIVSLLVLILTSIVSLGNLLEGRWYVPETNSVPTVERGGVENENVRSGQSRRVENQKADARG